MLQRIIFINKEGQWNDMVLDIIGKKSKCIIVRNPEDGLLMPPIPRKNIESISDPVKDDTQT